MLDPEVKPKMAAYAIESALATAAFDSVFGLSREAGSHRARVMAVHRASAAIMLLKRPSLSQMYPGAQRPMHEPAFMMAIS